MPNRSEIMDYGMGFAANNARPLAQLAISAAIEFGIVDDVTFIGVGDNPAVALGTTILEYFVLKAGFNGSTGVGRTLTKSALTIATGGMMMDDATVIGIADNPVAAVTAGMLMVMNFNDWRKNRR